MGLDTRLTGHATARGSTGAGTERQSQVSRSATDGEGTLEQRCVASVYTVVLNDEGFKDLLVADPGQLDSWELSDEERAVLIEEAAAEVLGFSMGFGPVMGHLDSGPPMSPGTASGLGFALNKAGGPPPIASPAPAWPRTQRAARGATALSARAGCRSDHDDPPGPRRPAGRTMVDAGPARRRAAVGDVRAGCGPPDGRVGGQGARARRRSGVPPIRCRFRLVPPDAADHRPARGATSGRTCVWSKTRSPAS